MQTFDWIIVGGGITGAALSYELCQAGFSVLLLEQHPNNSAPSATRYSYGGIPYWSGTTPLTRLLCAEGIEIQRSLAAELGSDTQFRDLDLILTIGLDRDPQSIAQAYNNCAIAPRLVSASQARELEPLLNPEAIAAALVFPHAQINASLLAAAYCNALKQHGGEVIIAKVEKLVSDHHGVQGAVTAEDTYHAINIVVCAGGMSRQLLRDSGMRIRQYFTHAELIETEPVELELRTLVMPAENKRLQFETIVGNEDADALWDEPDRELALPSIDAGAIQFGDRTIKIGQLSRVLTNPYAQVDAMRSEAEIRAQVGQILPAIATLPGQWHRCLVAFSQDALPLIGAVPDYQNVHIFSGFTSPMVYVPTLARRFAAYAAGASDPIIAQLSPQRFT